MPFTLKPGSHVTTIQTWRPQRRGPAEQLQEYFLGLAPQIESLNYAGIPNNEVTKFFFKYSFVFSPNAYVIIEQSTCSVSILHRDFRLDQSAIQYNDPKRSRCAGTRMEDILPSIPNRKLRS